MSSTDNQLNMQRPRHRFSSVKTRHFFAFTIFNYLKKATSKAFSYGYTKVSQFSIQPLLVSPLVRSEYAYSCGNNYRSSNNKETQLSQTNAIKDRRLCIIAGLYSLDGRA